jgi:hypothetical protein
MGSPGARRGGRAPIVDGADAKDGRIAAGEPFQTEMTGSIGQMENYVILIGCDFKITGKLDRRYKVENDVLVKIICFALKIWTLGSSFHHRMGDGVSDIFVRAPRD